MAQNPRVVAFVTTWGLASLVLSTCATWEANVWQRRDLGDYGAAKDIDIDVIRGRDLMLSGLETSNNLFCDKQRGSSALLWATQVRLLTLPLHAAQGELG